VPNSKAITMPETTPSPKAMPKILSQNSKSIRYAGRPVARCSPSRTVSQAASPIVNDGKTMWKETVKANCSRDRTNAERSIERPYRRRLNGLHANTRKISIVTGLLSQVRRIRETHLFTAYC
jgi:hypothetical protein